MLIPNVTAGVNAVVGEGSAAKEDRPVPCRVIVVGEQGLSLLQKEVSFHDCVERTDVSDS